MDFSLFVKDILLQISENTKKTRHFCVFDELYSGTNPYEAIGSAYSFLKYLNKYDNVSFMLTTHFLDLCKRLDSEEKILNCNMKIDTINKDDFKYTYIILLYFLVMLYFYILYLFWQGLWTLQGIEYI